ncbi:MAG: TolC family protein [Gemmatimonadales bacterium]
MTWRAVCSALLLCLCGLAGTARAQERVPLTLEQAIELARQNNPTFLQSVNALGPAGWGVKAANANLFLPDADLRFFTSWQDAGDQRFGAFTSLQPSVLLSQYQFSLTYSLNGTTLFQPGQAKAEREAATKRVDDANLQLSSQVTAAYLEVLRLAARAEQAERELRRSEEHLRLAEAREEVGAGTRLETMQADVARGRAEVNLVLAQNAARVSKLRLVQALGVQIPADRIDLVSEFEIFQPTIDMQGLLNDAMQRHPQLIAARADRNAANSTVKVAKAAYFPTLALQASWSGFTREVTDENQLVQQNISSAQSQSDDLILVCNQFADLYDATGTTPPPPYNNCSQFELTDDDITDIEQQTRAINGVYPFSFSNEPVTLSAFFSLPLFRGFDRQLQVEQAIARRNDLDYQVRGLELQVRANVTEAAHNLETAHRTVLLQEENTRSAREELRLAQERYQLGAGTFLELLDSQTLAAQAEVDQIESVFAFHQSLASLEAAVGRPLQLAPRQ